MGLTRMPLGRVFRAGVFTSRAGAEALQNRLERLSGPAWIVEYAGVYAVESERPPAEVKDRHVPVGTTVDEVRAICVRAMDARLEAKRIQDDERIGACYEESASSLYWYSKATGRPVQDSNPPRCIPDRHVGSGG